jgi:predicted DNA-binding protein YlxM (UPF0122 family)
MEIVPKKRYDALHAFFADRLPVAEVAEKYGYTQSSLYSLIRHFLTPPMACSTRMRKLDIFRFSCF